MAKGKKQEQTKPIENVEQTLSRTEKFLEENYKSLLYGLVVIVLIVGAVWLTKSRITAKTEEAHSQIYIAEEYFATDSLNLALYGDGNYLGFIDIAQDYKNTKAGNLANYYAGVCYLRMGEFQNAIDHFLKFKHNDNSISAVALGCTGDAYIELGETDKGIEFYLEAADYSENSFFNPLYILKAGQIHELEGRYDEALKLYQRIKTDYPDSSEGRNIDKYIARVKMF